MAENIQRSRGRPQNYKFDRGGMPAEMGPYVGIVVNNVDTTRSGRLQVYIEEFGATTKDGKPNLNDSSLWRTVNYCPPFYGTTAQSGTSASSGTYPGNSNSYGMWFTPPDIGVKVLCFFVGGDPSAGYYVGCIPENGINHMIPAIGSSSKYTLGNNNQSNYFANAKLLPVTEINQLNKSVSENPKFYNQDKPVQSVVAGILLQQGLINDPIRGPIRSNSQRESPSTVYGISTPGKPIYQGGLNPKTIQAKLDSGSVKPQDIVVIGRQGGHTLVMDDGDLTGTDTLVRIRTAKGHQITMSDDGNCFYICHANGQSWVELGQNGTIDLYSTNSVNVRTQGTINLHADKDINMYAGGSIKLKSNNKLRLEGVTGINMFSSQAIAMHGETKVTVKSDGVLALQGKTSSWNGGTSLNLKGAVINLNGAATQPASKLSSMAGYTLPDTTFVTNQGWVSQPGTLSTIATRAPTHEPFAGHNSGVIATTNLDDQSTTAVATDTTTNTPTNIQAQAAEAYVATNAAAVQNPISADNYVSETPSTVTIPITTRG